MNGQRTLPALALVLLLPAPAAVAGTSRCRVGPRKTKVATLLGGACRLKTTTAQIKSRTGATTVKLTGQELVCGALRLGHWGELARMGLETCRELGGSFYDYERSYRVRGIVGKVVGVDCEEGGYMGGAHGSAMVTRRSYDLRTGKQLSLAQLYPKRHAALIARSRAQFEAHPEREGYAFESRAFVLQVHKQGLRLEFAMPHSVEVLRGATLKLQLYVGPPAAAYR